MSELPDFSRYGEYGYIFIAAIAVSLAVLKLPLVLELLREVVPRRTRWLAKARELVTADGEFGVHSAIQREIESDIAHRLSGLKLSPAEFRVLAAMAADHPRDAAWSTIREWSDDIEIRDGRPKLTTGAVMRGMRWVQVALAMLLIVGGYISAVFVVGVMFFESTFVPLLGTLVSSLGTTALGLQMARTMQSPWRWQRLNKVFEGHSVRHEASRVDTVDPSG